MKEIKSNGESKLSHCKSKYEIQIQNYDTKIRDQIKDFLSGKKMFKMVNIHTTNL